MDNMNLNNQVLEERKKVFNELFDFEELKNILKNTFKTLNIICAEYGEPSKTSSVFI